MNRLNREGGIEPVPMHALVAAHVQNDITNGRMLVEPIVAAERRDQERAASPAQNRLKAHKQTT